MKTIKSFDKLQDAVDKIKRKYTGKKREREINKLETDKVQIVGKELFADFTPKQRKELRAKFKDGTPKRADLYAMAYKQVRAKYEKARKQYTSAKLKEITESNISDTEKVMSLLKLQEQNKSFTEIAKKISKTGYKEVFTDIIIKDKRRVKKVSVLKDTEAIYKKIEKLTKYTDIESKARTLLNNYEKACIRSYATELSTDDDFKELFIETMEYLRNQAPTEITILAKMGYLEIALLYTGADIDGQARKWLEIINESYHQNSDYSKFKAQQDKTIKGTQKNIEKFIKDYKH